MTAPQSRTAGRRTRLVTVDNEGVLFGAYCWFSHERITGIVPDVLKLRGQPFAFNYMNWLEEEVNSPAGRLANILDAMETVLSKDDIEDVITEADHLGELDSECANAAIGNRPAPLTRQDLIDIGREAFQDRYDGDNHEGALIAAIEAALNAQEQQS